MKLNLITKNLLLGIIVFCSSQATAQVISFESTIPTGWSATNGNISVSQDKAKLGSSSLCWQWNGGSVITATENTIQTTSNQNNGGITMWIYNTVPSDASITISFHSTSGKKCSLPFNLNFKGWRCLWARYREDMGLANADKGTITTMKIEAPAAGSGTIYFDYLEFITNVSWEKISNFQYTVKESVGIESFRTIRNITPPAPVSPTDAQRQAFQTITQRLDDWYYGSGNYTANNYFQTRSNYMRTYITRGVNAAPTIAANGTVNKSGLFPHDHFHNKTVDGVKLVSSRNVGEGYMLQLVYDYKKNKKAASLDKALELLDWYYDQGWADGSALGALRMEMLRSAGYYHSSFMLRNELGEERLKRISDASRWLTLYGMTYTDPKNPGELADYIRALAIPKLFYALMLPDEAERTTALISYQKYLNNAFKHAQGFLGSLKPDGSGYHHRAPYYSAYYPQVLYVGCFLYYILYDTPFALSEETYQNLKQGLMAFRFFSAEYNVPGSTGGRFPHQTEILQQLIPAFAYLAVTREESDVIAAFKRLWQPNHASPKGYISSVSTDICYTSTYGEVEPIIQAAALPGEPEVNPVGSLYLPFSGLLVVRQPDWVLTIKGFSKHIWDYESSGTENLYGRYLSYGHQEYTDLANNYRTFDLTRNDTDGKTEWDWNLLAGTTTKYLSKTNLSYLAANGLHRNFSDQTFLGGIGLDDRYSMFTNRIHDNAIDNSFYADKSVFIFGNVVYCMGSGINDRNTTTPFYTTLFQNNKTEGTTVFSVNGEAVTDNLTDLENPVIRDNFDNVYIVHGGFTNVNVGNTYISACINHGKRIVDKTYNYTRLIKPTDEQVELYKNNSPIQVLRQDKTAHAVFHPGESLFAASIFEAGVAVDLFDIHKVNVPLLFMMKRIAGGYEVAFSNPDMNRPSAANNDALTDAIAEKYGEESEIVIELNGTFTKMDGDNSEVSVTNAGGITTISYPKAHDGKTYRVKLVGTSVGISHETLSELGVSAWMSLDTCHLKFTGEAAYEWSLMDVNGRSLNTGAAVNHGATIDMSAFPAGMYFLKIRVGEESRVFKLIK